MGWIRNHAFGLSLGMLLVSGGLLVLVVGYIGLLLFSAVETGASVVSVLSGLMIPYAPVVAVLLAILLVSGIVFSWKTLAFGWRSMRRVTMPKSERLKNAAEHAEEKYPIFDALELAELVAPAESSTEDAIEDLKRQYIAGNLSENELEQRLNHLVAAESANSGRGTDEHDVSSNEGTAVLSKAWNEPQNQPNRR
jgi:hypothetical protein